MGQLFAIQSNCETTIVADCPVSWLARLLLKPAGCHGGGKQMEMASTMKLKFAGFLKGLLRHMDEQPARRPVSASVPPRVAAPSSVTTAPETPTEMVRRAVASVPPPVMAPANAAEILLPLAPVIAHLPMDLKAKLMSAPAAGQTIAVGVETILSQLAFGTVKIPFGELRRLTPGLFANSGGEFDGRQINLPLQEILTRLNPAVLARRASQKVDVAEEVAGPFDGRGRGITFTTQPLKATAATPTVSANIPAPSEVAPRNVTPKTSGGTEIFTFTPRQTAPPSAPIPFNPNPPSSMNNGNGRGHSNGNGNGNGHTVLPPFKFTTAPTPATPAASSLPRPEPAQSVLLVSLDDLAEAWPEALRNEIQHGSLRNVDLPLPSQFVDAGLKRGRVTMTWQAIRTLIKPSSPATPYDSLELELPLKVLAPAFFGAQKNNHASKKLVVAEEIPNLFFGFPQGSAESFPPDHAGPTAAPTPASAAPPTAPKPADTNFFVADATPETLALRMTLPAPHTDFVSRHTPPQEIVERAIILPGVAGAVVALADGLRVASQVPETLSGDTVAAFLPQIFERVNQSTRELRMGALNNVSFTVGNVPWKIFRVNSVYFAAFGRAGEALPKAKLAGLAAELDRKNKN